MTVLNCKLCAFLLLASPLVGFGQAGATKPVLQAAPQAAQAPAAQAPAAQTPVATGMPINVPAAIPGSEKNDGPPPGESSSNYIIGVGDTIEILVWKEPGLSNASIPVRPDGMISMALLGDLPAAGFTPMKLSGDVTERLKKYVTDPRVTVSVLGVHQKEVYMLGEIQRVGPVPITQEMTVLQAIAAAGGLSAFAKSTHIYILRTEAGKQRKIAFNYKKAIKDGNLQGVSLIPGDTIVVP